MDRSRYELAPGVWLDAHRAIWFEEEKVLAVADLHLGYAWAQRTRGLLLPLNVPEDALDRLLVLQAEYRPRETVLLGDIMHRALPLPALEAELEKLVSALATRSRLTLVAGNHDKDLGRLLGAMFSHAVARASKPVVSPTSKSAAGGEVEGACRFGSLRCVAEVAVGRHLLVHGDGRCEPNPTGSWLIMGHEHPAICLGDGVANSIKCPCFLVSESVVILPAFSQWAAGTVVGSYGFMSSLAQETDFKMALAICGEKLVPVRL